MYVCLCLFCSIAGAKAVSLLFKEVQPDAKVTLIYIYICKAKIIRSVQLNDAYGHTDQYTNCSAVFNEQLLSLQRILNSIMQTWCCLSLWKKIIFRVLTLFSPASRYVPVLLTLRWSLIVITVEQCLNHSLTCSISHLGQRFSSPTRLHFDAVLNTLSSLLLFYCCLLLLHIFPLCGLNYWHKSTATASSSPDDVLFPLDKG